MSRGRVAVFGSREDSGVPGIALERSVGERAFGSGSFVGSGCIDFECLAARVALLVGRTRRRRLFYRTVDVDAFGAAVNDLLVSFVGVTSHRYRPARTLNLSRKSEESSRAPPWSSLSRWESFWPVPLRKNLRFTV